MDINISSVAIGGSTVILILLIIIMIIIRRKKSITEKDQDVEVVDMKPQKFNLSLLHRLSFILADEEIYDRHLAKATETPQRSPSQLLNDAFCSSTVGDGDNNITPFSPVFVEDDNDHYINMQKQRLSILSSDNIVYY